MTEQAHRLYPGDVVEDMDAEEGDRDRIIVVGLTNEMASDVVLYEEPSGRPMTVDEYNHGYDDSPVVEVVYEEAAPEVLNGPESVVEAFESGALTRPEGDGGWAVQAYSFPESRLQKVNDP